MSKLIEKEGKFYKECGVVMLEAGRGTIALYKKTGNMAKPNINVGIFESDVYQPQHLYITSDDEIKEGDWCLFFWDGGQLGSDKPQQYQSSKGHVLNKGLRKIISTTDKLCIGHEDDYDERSKTGGNPIWLPQSSDKFIQAYIDAYNKGEKIEKVLVEYEKGNFRPDGSQGYFEPGAFTFEWLLKLKDNNIIIKKMKDNWTREEVETSHLSMAVDIAKHILQGNSFTTFNPEEWIKQNL